jgi:hypothetical protein
MENKNAVRLGWAILRDDPGKGYLARVDIDGEGYRAHYSDIIDGLNYILQTVTTHCHNKNIEFLGKDKRISYCLSMHMTNDGRYEIVATARKSHFIMRVRDLEDCIKVLEALDIMYPKHTLRLFIGDSAREALRWIREDSSHQ